MIKVKVPLFAAFIGMTLLSCGGSDERQAASRNDSVHAQLSFSGAFALYPLVVRWTDEYNRLNPGVTFDVQAGGAGKGMADALSGMVDAGMVSRSVSTEERAKGAWPFAVARDAVVATVHSGNPYRGLLNSRGITREQFRRIWIEGSIHTWGELLNNGSREKIQVFTRSDAAGAPETWARYLGSSQENLKGIGVFGDPGVAESVAQDKFAIGFNNANYVYDLSSRKPYEGLRAVPVDLDSSGVLEESENFYETTDALNTAIADGRYPSPPARELYFVLKGSPSHPALKKFLKWILTDGQKFVEPSGYVKLDSSLLRKELGKLN
jgi:phosphate transport system substrate-binding protein